MILLSYNVRGLNPSNKAYLIKDQISRIVLYIVFLEETIFSMIDTDKLIKSWQNWSYFIVPSIGALGGVGILLRHKKFEIQLLSTNANWIVSKVTCFELSFIVINVYSPTAVVSKERFWGLLTGTLHSLQPLKVVLVSDFNANLGPQKKFQHLFLSFIYLIMFLFILQKLLCHHHNTFNIHITINNNTSLHL